MSKGIDYTKAYVSFDTDSGQGAIRRDAYDVDIGQHSWTSSLEFDSIIKTAQLANGMGFS